MYFIRPSQRESSPQGLAKNNTVCRCCILLQSVVVKVWDQAVLLILPCSRDEKSMRLDKTRPGHFLWTFCELFEDFPRTFLGNSWAFLRTFWKISEDFWRTFWGHSQSFYITIWVLSQNFWGSPDKFMWIFWGLSKDFLRASTANTGNAETKANSANTGKTAKKADTA